MSENEIKSQIKEWLISKSKNEEAAKMTNDTKIIGERVITSLQIMDLMLFMEQLSKKRLDPEDLKPGIFSTINQIYETYYG